jgi:PAS domain S-box-containing protein
MIYVKDSASRFVLLNPAVMHDLGAATPDEVLGKTDFDFHPPELAAQYYADEQAIMQSGQPLVNKEEFNVDHETGSRTWVLATKIPLRDSQGKIVGLVGVNRDITERKQAEEELRTYHHQLQAANTELSQYAYIVSHDLQAPLRAIRNYAGFLQDDLAASLTGDQRMYLDGLTQAAGEAQELVRDLLELSQIGHQRAPTETIDLGVFLRTLVASLNLPADVEVSWAEEWPTIEAEPTLLRQIFQNLILNAVTFNRSTSKCIALGWREVEPDRYELYVRDNGIGIAPRYQAQIFGVFQRLHTRQEYAGTGIGLAIVQKAISKLLGSVRVESTPGAGSTFFVTLPRRSQLG